MASLPPPVSSANGDKPPTSICPPTSPAKSPLIAGHAEERWLLPSWLEWQRSVWKLLTPTHLLSEVSGGWQRHHETGTNGPVSNRALEKQMPVPSLPYPWEWGGCLKSKSSFWQVAATCQPCDRGQWPDRAAEPLTLLQNVMPITALKGHIKRCIFWKINV